MWVKVIKDCKDKVCDFDGVATRRELVAFVLYFIAVTAALAYLVCNMYDRSGLSMVLMGVFVLVLYVPNCVALASLCKRRWNAIRRGGR